MTDVTRTVIAGDFGGTWLRAALVDETGTIHDRREAPTPRTTDAAEVTRVVVALLASMVPAGGPAPAAVCIATAGLVDADRGRVDISPNIPAFRNLALTGPVSEQTGLPAFIENDASAAALGEYRFGAARGVRHLLHATLGTGIGGGIVVNGHLYRGANGLAGEIGHTVIDVSGPRCKCGSRGCLEAMASGVAFAERARRLIESGKSPLLAEIAGDGPPTGVHLVEAARRGDRASEAEIRNGGHLLGVAIGGFINILNPDMVTLSGGLLEIGDMLLDPLHQAVKAFGYGASPRTPIRLSELGDDAGLLGAAAVAFERLAEG
ncbi:MAG: ROK family protein [Dehalococcoidia bacterium]